MSGDTVRDLEQRLGVNFAGQRKSNGRATKTASKNGRKPKPKKPTVKNDRGVEESIDDPYRLARLYLSEYPNTVRWREDFYVWTDPAYKLQTDDDVKSELVDIIKEEFDRLAGHPSLEQFEVIKITKTLLTNVLECLKALTHKPSDREEPFWL